MVAKLFLPISFSLAISDADPFQLKERQKNTLPLIQLEYNQKISSDELIQLYNVCLVIILEKTFQQLKKNLVILIYTVTKVIWFIFKDQVP